MITWLKDSYEQWTRERKRKIAREERKKRWEELWTEAETTLLYELNEQQQDALRPLLWFFYGERGTGRTRTSVTVAILQAIKQPGIPHRVFDHWNRLVPHEVFNSYLMSTLESIIKRLPEEIGSMFIIKKVPIPTIQFLELPTPPKRSKSNGQYTTES